MNALTERERDILARIASGATSKEIADELHVSEVTVKFHVANVLKKLGAHSRSEAVAIAVGAGLIPRHFGAGSEPTNREH